MTRWIRGRRIDSNLKNIVYDAPGRWLHVPYLRPDGDIGTKIYAFNGMDRGMKKWKWVRSELFTPSCGEDNCQHCKENGLPKTEELEWETSAGK